MIMHPLLGHGVLVNTFQPQHLGIGAHSIYELTVGSSSVSGYDGFVLFCLSEHLQPVRERRSVEKGNPSEGHNAPTRYFLSLLPLFFADSTGGPDRNPKYLLPFLTTLLRALSIVRRGFLFLLFIFSCLPLSRI